MPVSMEQIEREQRFAFGKNWQSFLRVLDEERIAEAQRSLRNIIEIESFAGKTFLDVGSGSGLFSLAAMRLGARRVHSFDYDMQSVACTQELKRRYFPLAEHWTVEHGDVLDSSYLSGLGQFDVVYSWGVLHHTGNLWQALANATIPVGPNGKLIVALYNDQGWISGYWKMVKKLYQKSPLLRLALITINSPYLIGLRFLVRLIGNRLGLPRGMALWYDMKDWLGGYPFEVAKPERVRDFYMRNGLRLIKLNTCGRRSGNNEYVFSKTTEPGNGRVLP